MYSNFKYETLVLIRRGYPVGGWQVRCCHRKKVDTGQARAVINARNDAINVQLKNFWREKIWVGFCMKIKGHIQCLVFISETVRLLQNYNSLRLPFMQLICV